MFLRKRQSCKHRHCRCLAKNRNRLESPLGVWTNPVYKTSWSSLPAKQAITIGSSWYFYVKLLHDWSNFDLPKLMPVEHISLIPSSCFSNTLRIQANKLLITAQPIRNLRRPASAEMNKRGFLYQASLSLSPQTPSFSPSPYPLPLSTPAPQAGEQWILRAVFSYSWLNTLVLISVYCEKYSLPSRRRETKNVKDLKWILLVDYGVSGPKTLEFYYWRLSNV